MLVRARDRGWRVVVFNSRGCGNSPVTTPQVSICCSSLCGIEYHIALTSDDFSSFSIFGIDILVYDSLYNTDICSSIRLHF